MGTIEVIELHTGIMTNEELAEWFGIKEKSLRSTRAKKLEILKEYAEFEDMYGKGKVNITRIIEPIYKKGKGSKNFNFVKEKTLEQWSKTGLDTCKLVQEKISEKYADSEVVKALKDSSLYTYTCTSKRALWGKAFKSGGEIGVCVYEMCKEINNECVPFTEEELKIKKELLNKYYGEEVNEKLVFIKDMLDNKELTPEECWQELKEMADIENRYLNYKKELEKILKVKVVRGTRVEMGAFKVKDGDFDF